MNSSQKLARKRKDNATVKKIKWPIMSAGQPRLQSETFSQITIKWLIN